MPPVRPAGAAALAVALAGGIAFGASLMGFAWALRAGGTLAADAGPWTAAGWRPLAADTALFTAFALHHSVFARLGVKRWLTRRLPAALERSAYVWVSSVLFAATYLLWQPVPGRLWAVHGPWRALTSGLQVTGVVLTLAAARRLSVFDLAGVSQVLESRRPAAQPDAPELVTSGLYRLVRHPIYLGWVLMVWPAAVMTGTHAAFAALSTLYLAAAIPFEERGLRAAFGHAYVRYQSAVRWRMVPFVY